MAADARRVPSRQAAYENLVLNRRIEASNPFVSPSLCASPRSEVALDAHPADDRVLVLERVHRRRLRSGRREYRAARHLLVQMQPVDLSAGLIHTGSREGRLKCHARRRFIQDVPIPLLSDQVVPARIRKAIFRCFRP